MIVSANTPEGRMAHAFLDGVDVSHLCVMADDEAGWVDLLVKDENGKIQIDGWHDPIIKRHTGTVVIKLNATEVE